MSSGSSTLSSSDIEDFARDGYVVVKQAFSKAAALAMEERWWAELESAHGVRREDRSTWRNIRGDLKAAKHDPIQEKISSRRVRGVLDDLLGEGAWSPPQDWGRPIVTFPEPGDWDVPTHFWHWDNPWEFYIDGLLGLFVVSFIGEVRPRGGGSLILSGSPRLVMQQEARLAPDQRRNRAVKPWDRLHASDPWLKALTGKAPSPKDRIAAFMDRDTVIDGVALRVVELTGEPGDMVFCHPAMVHCGAPNRGERPRFMRIKQQLLTEEGRKLMATLS